MKIQDPDYVHRGKVSGVDVWLHHTCPKDSILPELTLQGANGAERIFKQEPNRTVCVRRGDRDLPILLKTSLHTRLKEAWKASRLAPLEIAAHLYATRSGIPTPRLLGWFERRNWLGLPTMEGLLIEFLPHAHHPERSDIRPAADLLVQLYQHHLHFPDLMRSNVMVDQQTGRNVLIDFERCTILPSPSLESVLMSLGRYLEYDAMTLDDQPAQELAHTVYDSLNLTDFPREDFLQALRLLNQRHLSTKMRCQMRLPTDVRAILAAHQRN